ncbi:DNA/RNA helicase, DEAD/DEAH box type [Moelleriella libera RCEF 2490]|uniref:ATP-dependent RNA helicase n=1 Tax=Moelleriella libera RCEF 2490 TaxID=1081109 RepID=A0A167YLE6_9HYPO|nr:DNA/RNA helicase, DEAD/DEAH box type [Moelleriella libera RCEF 2490]
MYARYVPPPKATKAASNTSQPTATAQRSPAVAAAANTNQPKLANGFGYARYVPAPKPAATPSEIKPASIQYFQDEPESANGKRKRDADSASHHSEAKKLKATSDGAATRHVPVDGAKTGEKRKNRRKRKRRTRAASDTSEDSDSDSTPAAKSKTPTQASIQGGQEFQHHAEPTEDVAPPESVGRNGALDSDVEMEDASTAVDAGRTTELAVKPKEHKPKREKTKKSRKSSQQEEPAIGGASDSDTGMTGASTAAEEVSATEPVAKSEEKKPKREKKKKIKGSSQDDDAADVDDAENERDLARHKAVLERRAKSIKLANRAPELAKDEPDDEAVEAHGLEPLPQPAVVPDSDVKPAYSTLPEWLAAPIRVSHGTQASFASLGIAERPCRILGEKGFPGAFAIQTAAIPLLLPTSKQRPGDVLVSAATGSGKTLAYALPIVRDISNGVVTRLRALVVLPTRELVRQAQEVFEVCAKAFEGEHRKRVRIGVAVGSQSLASEQRALLEQDARYDPEAYQKIFDAAGAKGALQHDDSATARDPRLGRWEGDVIEYMSKVDVLICTPGRLVDHMEQTPGFSLDYVRWLVVDEADKLLAQSFQGWLDRVLDAFRTSNMYGARDFPDMAYSGVRKVILSATLTRDLSLLGQLGLRRPQLIVLENNDQNDGSGGGRAAAPPDAEHTLPVSLCEFAVRVHETNLKPLYLLDLLRGPFMKSVPAHGTSPDARTPCSAPSSSIKDQASSSTTAAAAAAASDLQPERTSAAAQSASGSRGPSENTSSDDDSSSSEDETSSDYDSSSSDDDESTSPPPPPSSSSIPISLIFTKSNESALRLSRLLAILDPSLAPALSTLTSTTPTHIRRKVLRGFTTPSSPIRLIVASDLVARGIDLPELHHVINYDLPASVAG